MSLRSLFCQFILLLCYFQVVTGYDLDLDLDQDQDHGMTVVPHPETQVCELHYDNEVKYVNHGALKFAASFGHIDLMLALRICGVNHEAARSHANEVLMAAAGQGQEESLKVLHDVYGLTHDDAADRGGQAVCLALEGHHVETLEILRTLYEMKKEDIKGPSRECVKKHFENNGNTNTIPVSLYKELYKWAGP